MIPARTRVSSLGGADAAAAERMGTEAADGVAGGSCGFELGDPCREPAVNEDREAALATRAPTRDGRRSAS